MMTFKAVWYDGKNPCTRAQEYVWVLIPTLSLGWVCDISEPLYSQGIEVDHSQGLTSAQGKEYSIQRKN